MNSHDYLVLGMAAGWVLANFLGAAFTIRHLRNRALHAPPEAGIPRAAEFVAYVLLDADMCEAILGDMYETFGTEIVPKFGIRRARAWYWKEILISVSDLSTIGVARKIAMRVLQRQSAKVSQRRYRQPQFDPSTVDEFGMLHK